MISARRRLARDDVAYLAALARHQLVMLGYWIRPYDSHLDARRWRWTTSGRQRSYAAWNAIPQAHRDALIAAAHQAAQTRRAARVCAADEPPPCPGCSSPLCPDCTR